jgi:hypothetical protein
MQMTGKTRRNCCGGVALLFCLFAGAAFAAAPESSNSSELLAHADAIKTIDNANFAKQLDQLDKNANSLTDVQKWYLRYLQGWQLGYTGQGAKAKPLLEAIIKQAPDSAIRMNATAVLINILGYGHQKHLRSWTRDSRVCRTSPTKAHVLISWKKLRSC